MEQNLDSRNYDMSSVEQDPRFVQCKKEFFVTFLIIAATLLVTIVIAFVIPWGPASGYSFVFGFPMWAFLCLAASLAGTIVMVIYALKGVKDVPLGDVDDDGKEINV